ncbi:MAG: hypothetical protein GXY87_06085 [Tissierellia bacterium]|nr:hypothetical protein [Tissierellia bacterium]
MKRNLTLILVGVILVLSACSKNKNIDLSEFDPKKVRVYLDDKEIKIHTEIYLKKLENLGEFKYKPTQDIDTNNPSNKVLRIEENGMKQELYIYIKDDKDYIEQGYIGVWELKENEYKEIIGV